MLRERRRTDCCMAPRARVRAALAAELLETIAMPDDGGGDGDGDGSGSASVELLSLREAHTALLEEATFYKRQAQQLESENRRLSELTKGIHKTRKQLLQQIASLEATLQKERREWAAMEVALSEAYTQALRELVASHEAAHPPPPPPPPPPPTTKHAPRPPLGPPPSKHTAAKASAAKKGLFR